MRVAIRTDASVEIGTGHLGRCLALAGALRKLGVDVEFVTRPLGIDSGANIRAAGYDVTILGDPDAQGATYDGPAHAAWAQVDWVRDAAETCAAVAVRKCDWVVVDHYAFDALWHRKVKGCTGARLAIIDDLADRELAADVLIDTNLADPDHRTKYARRILPESHILGGPRYALLGPGYADAPKCEVHEEVRSVGIFLGGADSGGLSELALLACREHACYGGPIELVTTRANPNHARLVEVAARWPQTTVVQDLPTLVDFFAKHDLQIGAGGTSTWERCCVGAPTLTVVAADNQRAVVPLLALKGATAALPEGEALTAAGLGRAVRQLLLDADWRRSLAERSRALVDGRGAERVALRLAGDRMCVRRATEQDAERMYRWRNDPVTRAVSLNSATFSFEEHRKWLGSALGDGATFLFIGVVGDLPVGVVRFECADPGMANVSIYLDPALHGLGLGSRLLDVGEAAVRRENGAVRSFRATVLRTNPGSRRMFERAGYLFNGEQGQKVLVG